MTTQLRLYDASGTLRETVSDVTESDTTLADGRVRHDVRATSGGKLRASVIRPVSAPAPVPAPTPVPVPSGFTFGELLAADMSGKSEAVPEGQTLDWDLGPQKRNFPISSAYHSATFWGVLDNVVGGPVGQPGRAQIASAELWFKSKSTGQWTCAQKVTGLLAGADYADNWSNASQDAGQTPSVYGGTSAGAVPAGTNFHFYPDGDRADINPADISAVVVVIRARLEPNTFNPASPPQYTLCAAADGWTTSGAVWNNLTTNGDIGIGKFKKVDASMRAFTMSQGDLSTLPPVTVAASELR